MRAISLDNIDTDADAKLSHFKQNVSVSTVVDDVLICSCAFLPLDEAVVSRPVFGIVSGSDAWVETLLEPAKQLKRCIRDNRGLEAWESGMGQFDSSPLGSY